MRAELNHWRDHFDHASIEIDGSARRQLQRRFFPRQQLAIDECRGVPPIFFRIDLYLIEPDVELRLHADGRHLEPGPLRDPVIAAKLLELERNA